MSHASLSVLDLADLFEGEDVEFTGKDEADPADRQDYLWQRRLQENQDASYSSPRAVWCSAPPR